MSLPEIRDAELAMAAEKLATEAVDEEAQLIACFFVDETIAREFAPRLRPEDLTDYAHQCVLRVFQRLIERQEAITVFAVRDKLFSSQKAKNAIEAKGGWPWLVDLAASIPTTAHAEHYFAKVRAVSIRRQLARKAYDIKALAFNIEEADPVSAALGLILSIQGMEESKVRHIKDVLRSQINRIEAAHEMVKAGGRPPVAQTGFYDLDQKLAMTGGKLIVVGARPAMGKSAWAFQVACNVAGTDPVLMVTLEMVGEELAARMISADTGLTANQQAYGAVRDDIWPSLMQMEGQYEELELYIQDSPAATIAQIEGAARRLTAHLGRSLGLLVIDYLGLLDGDGKDEQAKVGGISRGAKQMAMRLNIPVVMLSQLSRALESRTDKRPQLSDLRSSGSVEQDADIILFIYRDEYYNPGTDAKGVAEIIAAKNRGGSAGTVSLYFDGPKTKFSNIPDPHGYNLPAIDDGSAWITPPPVQEFDDV
jgi:replicative DNA helicase